MEHWSLTTLWEKLVKIGAKVVRVTLDHPEEPLTGVAAMRNIVQ